LEPPLLSSPPGSITWIKLRNIFGQMGNGHSWGRAGRTGLSVSVGG